MTRAADILRKRAEALNYDSLKTNAFQLMNEWRAVADLMDACVDEEPDRFQCRVCRSAGRSDVYRAVRVHTGDCKLAALERLITGESDATSK